MIAVLAQATPTTTNGPVTHLTGSDRWVTLGLVVGFVLLAGVVIAGGRRALATPPTQRSGRREHTSMQETGEDATLVRSWLAISLVGGLLIFVALSFWIDDTGLRSALIGGLVANAGAAVAFYFASKSSDQARRDILSASLPMTIVPDLIGKTISKVNEAIAATSLRVQASPATADPEAQVVSQQPLANQSATPGSVIAVTLAGPVPDLSDLTLAEAQAELEAVNLVLVPDPASPGAGTKVQTQTPAAGGEVPTDRNVGATFQ